MPLQAAPSPSQAEVQSALTAARSQWAGAEDIGSSVLDHLLIAHPIWPWVDLLPRYTGVSMAAYIALTPKPLPQAVTGATLCLDPQGQACLAMLDPWNFGLLEQAQSQLQQLLPPVAVTGRQFSDLTHAVLGQIPAPSQPNGRDQASPGEGGTAVELVAQAIEAAWNSGASDIHFECDRQGLQIKLRIDGVLRPLRRRDGPQLAEELISRIKVLSQLDITERRLPQDGRIRHVFNASSAVDLRVSIMPSVFGEDAVLRLLDKSTLRTSRHEVTLDGLGFDMQAVRRMRRLATQPHGMLLVTGPTGSGKTTSVYAALSEINTGQEKIITIEDPVEYELPGVLQIPVNERKGLTFAKGLRSILRHDPDRILVGEIRDPETAAIAVQSALTGHLVFTTVHANSLFDVIGRFRHFGLDMFGFVSSLNGVVVQRLLRKVCPQCLYWTPPDEEMSSWLAEQRVPLLQVPRGRGCNQCGGIGYRGRFVLAEVHRLDDRLRDSILGGADVATLKTLVFSAEAQVQPLLVQAIDHVSQGLTTMEEVFRVVGQG